MKQIKSILLVLLAIISLCLVSACTTSDEPKKEEYTITFETNGGTSIGQVKFTKDEKAKKPADPTLKDATLAAWCTDENLENEFDFDQVPENKNYTLYAKWNVTINFITNGGEEITNYHRNAKEMVILPVAQDLGERQFLGWYYDEECSNKVESILEVPNHPITLYAKWASVEMGTTIDFLESLVVNEEGHYTISKNEEGVTIKPTASKTAWSYLYSPINLVLEGYSVLHIKFSGTESSYMTVKLEGGDVKAIEQKFIFTGVEQNEYWAIPEENISKTGNQRILIFVEGDKAGNDFDSEVMINTLEFCKLKGSDEEPEQAIIFNSNGGSLVPTINAPYNSTLTMPENPTKAGFKFAGWYRDQELTVEFTDKTMPMGPTTLYAKWEDADAHTVSFVTNCDLVVDQIEVKEGLLIPTEELEVLGWKFVGWYRNAELTDENLIMGTEDVTLYAKWHTLKDLSDLENPYSLMTGWSTNETNAYTVTETNNQISLVATPSKGKFSYISRELTGYDLSYVNALHIEFSGKIGQSILIKYNNKVEKKIIITQEQQEEWIYLTTPVNPSIKLLVFYAPNKTLTENETLTITEFEFLDPIEKLDYIDVKKGWTSNDPNQYTITENESNTEITATTAKTTWSFVRVDLSQFPDVNARFVKAINLEFTGAEGHSILIKYNNKKEQKVLLTGEKQAVSIEFAEQLDFSLTNHFIIFFDGGKTLEEDLTVTFTKMELVVRHQDKEIVYEEEIVDITKGWISADAGVYEVVENEDKTVVTANINKGTYSVLKFVVNESHAGAKSIRITLQGPAGKTILVKYNNAKEKKYTLTGELQTIELEFVVDLDLTKSLYIFFEPGKKIEEPMTVEFTKIELVCLVEVK